MTRMPAALLAVFLASSLLARPGAADTGATVVLPDTSALPAAEARDLLTRLAQVNVITSNCPAYALGDADWTLLTGTGDQLAAQLGLDASAYDRQVYAPAFRLLDDPRACDRIGPTAAGLIGRLRAMGGGAEEARR